MTKTERKARFLMEMRGYQEVRRSELGGVVELLRARKYLSVKVG